VRPFRISNFGSRIWPTVILILAILAAPFPSDGQQPAKVYRIGYLDTIPLAPTDTTPHHCPLKGRRSWPALLEGLREHGYILGQNLVIECRWTEGREERAPALAAELVSLKPDLIVAFSTILVRATKQVTSTIPILAIFVANPVERGLVASLAHPGGNITGLTDTADVAGKHLQLLKEAVPKLSRLAVLDHLAVRTPIPSAYMRETQAAAQPLHMTLQLYEVRNPEEITGAFTAMKTAQAEALLVAQDPNWMVYVQQIVELAARSRLPAMYPGRTYVEAGGLIYYGGSIRDVALRLGFYVDKILNGAKPSDLPMEQPSKFELVINMKTANALGLTIPQSLLLRADELIQ
jgi:putative ABC transport system substrate-binding protein